MFRGSIACCLGGRFRFSSRDISSSNNGVGVGTGHSVGVSSSLDVVVVVVVVALEAFNHTLSLGSPVDRL